MKRFLIALLLLMTIDTYSQEVIQTQNNIRQILIDYLIKTDGIPADFIESLESISKSNRSSDVFAEPVLIRDQINNNQVVPVENLCDIGIYTFYCPLCMPIQEYVFIKYYKEISILDDLNNKDILIKQIDWLINTFLNTHDNFSQDYLLKSLRTMLEVYDSNKMTDE